MFTCTIKTDNAAFEDDGGRAEVARILRDIASKLEDGQDASHRIVYDFNGNQVGVYNLAYSDTRTYGKGGVA